MNAILVADSGGTKTDWCFVDSSGKKEFFTTESYHPINWSESFEQSIHRYWENRNSEKSANLIFFSAGCLKNEKADELLEIMKRVGFLNVKVRSDLHAAGLASLGSKNGVVAILGTGSVMFDWENCEVENVIGGKGHEQGDEGSGFYFGKLVYQAYQANALSQGQRRIIEGTLDLDRIKNQIELGDTKYILAEIAFSLKEHHREFSRFHKTNVELFLDKHMVGNNSKEIYLVGSYVYFHASYFTEVFSKKGIIIKGIIHKPITSLVEQIVHFVE